MAVSATTSRVDYAASGTEYAVPFPFLEDTDLVVTTGPSTGLENTEVLGADYTVTNDYPDSKVFFSIAPTGLVVIRRSTPKTQPLDLTPNGPYDPEVIEEAFDRATLQIQEVADGTIDAAFVHGNLAGGALHGVATTSTAGFQSAADKLAWDNHTGAGGTVHAVATTSTAGFLSAADKLKLDGLSADQDPLSYFLEDWQTSYADAGASSGRWQLAHNGGDGTVPISTDDEWGAVRMLTNGADEAAMLVWITNPVVNVTRDPSWTFRVKIPDSTSFNFEFGVNDGTATAASGATSQYARFRRDDTAGLWYRESRGSSLSQASFTAPTDDTYAVYEIRFTTGGTVVEFYLDGTLLGTVTGNNVPAGLMRPHFRVQQKTASARELVNDYVLGTWTRAYT